MEVVYSIAFGLLFWTFTIEPLYTVVGDQNVVERSVHQLDDIRRQKVVDVAHDGSAAISGQYVYVNPIYRWPGGVLHWQYDVNNTFTDDQKATIVLAIEEIMTRTCLKFFVRTNETAYVSLTSDFDGGCSADPGFSGEKQEINFGAGCVYNRGVIHEFMHVLGFYHEQTRYDRDLYVKIEWHNILENYRSAFNKVPRTKAFSKYDFDFRSIMMYPINAFSINNTLSMEVLKNPSAVPDNEIGWFAYMTDTDAGRINSAYKCRSAPLHQIQNIVVDKLK